MRPDATSAKVKYNAIHRHDVHAQQAHERRSYDRYDKRHDGQCACRQATLHARTHGDHEQQLHMTAPTASHLWRMVHRHASSTNRADTGVVASHQARPMDVAHRPLASTHVVQ
jgi:hypothetical protein